MQEEVAEDMVKLARSLKRNATVAKEIIKKDTDVSWAPFTTVNIFFMRVTNLCNLHRLS